MKKFIYTGFFILLGLLLQFLVHAGIEMFYIGRLLSDFDTYGFGLSWETWELIHDATSYLLIAIGIWAGYQQAKKWYPRLYDKEGNLRTKRHPLQF